VVTILGEVYNPTSVVFVSDKSVQYYLDQTGGPTINADTESIFVIRSDGSVVSKRQNRGFLLRGFSQMKIEHSNTILVPKDITRFSWLNTTKDITEILFKIASTTGITITAFR
jgi:protein involved in polysaccharide export with SLBB domain